MSQATPSRVSFSIEGKKFAIVAARFNNDLCNELIAGAMESFLSNGVPESNIDLFRCPGAFEIPGLARKVIHTNRYQAVICLGAVIRGDTPHFDFVAGSCAEGILKVGLETGVPVIFGVLTTNTDDQAWQRALRSKDNKGAESALAAMEMADVYHKLS